MESDESAERTGLSRNVSRRDFLKISSSVAALGGVAYVVGTTGIEQWTGRDEQFGPIPNQTFAYADVVPPAPGSLPSDMLLFFTPEEMRAVEALTATLLPGTPDDPGAREARAWRYIDVKLSKEGFWEATYFEPPFASTYTGEPPAEAGAPYRQVWVAEDQLDRYGFQSRLTPREVYRGGLAALQQHCMQTFSAPFADLTETQQEEVVTALSEGNVGTFSEPSADDFFDLLQTDTAHGVFADPAYGGNQDLVGWKLIGYPGAQRAYTPAEMLAEDAPRPPQTLDGLQPFNSGIARDGDGAILPVSDGNLQSGTARGPGTQEIQLFCPDPNAK